MEQDSALVKRAQSGDTAAFGELYSLYWQQLYKFALYNLSNSEDAKDAVQDAVLAVYRNIGNIRDEDYFKTYIFRAVANNCKSIYRRRKRANLQPIDDFSNTLHEGGDEQRKQAFEIYSALDTLNENERLIITLTAVCGYKSGEIAKILHKPAGTVRSTLKRAIDKLDRDSLLD